MRLQGGKNPQKPTRGKTQYGSNPQGGTVDNMITNTLVGKGKLPKSSMEIPKRIQPTLNPQQIRAIKNSPKGVLPSFIQKMQSARRSMESGKITEQDLKRMVRKGK